MGTAAPGTSYWITNTRAIGPPLGDLVEVSGFKGVRVARVRSGVGLPMCLPTSC